MMHRSQNRGGPILVGRTPNQQVEYSYDPRRRREKRESGAADRVPVPSCDGANLRQQHEQREQDAHQSGMLCEERGHVGVRHDAFEASAQLILNFIYGIVY